MSVTTTADEHIARAKDFIEKARREVGAVLVERDMWGADRFREGYVRNAFDRVDAALMALEGKDRQGEERAAEIPPLEGELAR